MYVHIYVCTYKYLSVIKIHNEEGSLIENGSKLLGGVILPISNP